MMRKLQLMKPLLILAFLMGTQAWGQDSMRIPVKYEINSTQPGYRQPAGWGSMMDWQDLIRMWEEWTDSCKDTLHTEMYGGEYLIDHGSYRAMVSERQLRERGYKYAYRWITTTRQPFEWDYVFVKDPNNLTGFMDFIQRKQSEKGRN